MASEGAQEAASGRDGLGVPLSVLDVVPVTAAETAADALARAGRLARLVDELGFVRLWYAFLLVLVPITSPKTVRR